MKKYILIFALIPLIYSCGGDKKPSIDELIAAKNINELKLIKKEKQDELNKIQEALSSFDKKIEETLVETLKLKDTVFNHFLEIQGNVVTKENILIQPEMPGTLLNLYAKAGQRVTQGQLLGTIDDGGLSQQLAQVETQYELASTTFKKQENLWNQKIGSEIQYLQARTQKTSLEKQMAQLKKMLSKTQIRAPFTGEIDEVFVERGELVAPSPQGLMRLVNLNKMYVVTNVPEAFVGKFKYGTKVAVDINSIGKTYNGIIRQVGKNINPNNRSFGIEISVPNPEGLLRPNQVAKLKITDYTNNSTIVVPTNVVKEDASGDTYVFIAANVSNNKAKAKKVYVKTGKSGNNVTEILSGLNTGDLLVTEGVNNISEGMDLIF